MGAQSQRGFTGDPPLLQAHRVARSLLREIHRVATRVAASPLSWRARDELIPGLRSAVARPYTVFYRIRNEHIDIVRILHERRDFPAIFAKEER